MVGICLSEIKQLNGALSILIIFLLIKCLQCQHDGVLMTSNMEMMVKV